MMLAIVLAYTRCGFVYQGLPREELLSFTSLRGNGRLRVGPPERSELAVYKRHDSATTAKLSHPRGSQMGSWLPIARRRPSPEADVPKANMVTVLTEVDRDAFLLFSALWTKFSGPGLHDAWPHLLPKYLPVALARVCSGTRHFLRCLPRASTVGLRI